MASISMASMMCVGHHIHRMRGAEKGAALLEVVGQRRRTQSAVHRWVGSGPVSETW
jgi:hypothetical protein